MTFKQVKVVGTIIGAVVTTYLATKAVKKVKEDLAVHEAKVDKALEEGEKLSSEDIKKVGSDLIRDVAPTLLCGLLTGLLAYSVYNDIEDIDIEYVDHYIHDPGDFKVAMSKGRTKNILTSDSLCNGEISVEDRVSIACDAIDTIKDYCKNSDADEISFYAIEQVMNESVPSYVENDELYRHMFVSMDNIDDTVIVVNDDNYGGIVFPSFTVDDVGAELLKEANGKDVQIDDESVNNTRNIFTIL